MNCRHPRIPAPSSCQPRRTCVPLRPLRIQREPRPRRAHAPRLRALLAPAYSESEQEFGKNLQRAFGLSPKGYPTDLLPFDPQAPPIPGGSTDVANVSWVTPTADVSVATWPFGVPAHSWASTAASGAPGGYRAMHTAAQVLALTAADLLEDPDALREMREELQRARERFDYGPPVPKEAMPRLPWHERGETKK